MGDSQQQAEAEAEAERLYIRRHGVHVTLEELVGDMLRLRPPDPLAYIAMRLLSLRGVSQEMEKVLEVCIERKTIDDQFREVIRPLIGLPADGAEGASSSANSRQQVALGASTVSAPSLADSQGPGRGSGTIAARKQKQISARACTVCGRDDRPGEQRAKGFKCHQCVGLPSNPYYVKQIEEAQKVFKGRDEEGGFVMNDYTIMAQLGQGSYGKVRLCEHNLSKQLYAVKCLSKANIIKAFCSGNPTANREDALKSIREEIKIMKKLEHPNIIRIYGTMESDSELMIVMEYLEGGQVFPSSFPAPPLKVRKLKRIIVGIAKGLDFLHNNGVIHRDIKPDNILTDKRGNVKLADFGVSTEAEGATGQVTGFAGSPAFMAPELFEESASAIEGEPTDVWSFGITVYCMTFGHLPKSFASTTNVQELGASIRKTEIVFNHSCELLNDLLSRMLDKDPHQRATLPQICDHELLKDVRIVKGHPVETVELSMKWDEPTGTITLGCSSDGDPEGCETMKRFMRESKDQFQVITVNPYEVSLYDISRDPRRRVQEKAPAKPAKPKPGSRIEEEDWDSDDLEEEGM
eukprot:TRINITY_DN576_c0_g5_i1.p1 TRINITY_DN576_c0_g5~~TRINITY_DN576_c0_g5_i1.p1  ORF type:complete len:578 (+),score=153.40 TRINITY_DN576_c0_g5_i1:89-1822(+)